MVIQDLKPSARVEGRWLAVLEDGSILRLGMDQVADFGLYRGRELTGEEAEALTASVDRSKRREKALELLARKPQSRRELERKLTEWGADPAETAALCCRMEELGYLNDAEYARQVVRYYERKGFGAKKLRDELYRRGVPRDLWDQALEEAEDPAGAIDAFLAQKLAGKEPDPKLLQKVSAALARRGYSWSDIRDALGRYGMQNEEW